MSLINECLRVILIGLIMKHVIGELFKFESILSVLPLRLRALPVVDRIEHLIDSSVGDLSFCVNSIHFRLQSSTNIVIYLLMNVLQCVTALVSQALSCLNEVLSSLDDLFDLVLGPDIKDLLDIIGRGVGGEIVKDPDLLVLEESLQVDDGLGVFAVESGLEGRFTGAKEL